MKRITVALLATVAGAAIMSSAYAADLIVDEPAEVGVVDVSGNWDGLYIGGFVGYGWGEATDVNDWLDLDSGTEAYDLSGFLAGVTLGANFTVTDGIVAGIVGDLAWSNIHGEDYANNPGFDSTFDVNWIGSLRGRLGFDGGAFLPYLTAGLAVANATHSVDDNDLYTDTQTHIGWTVGAGVEFAVADNVSIDLLYRYSDYGTKEYDSYYPDTEIGLTTHTVQVGLNWGF